MKRNNDMYYDESNIIDIDNTNSYKRISMTNKEKKDISLKKIRLIIIAALLILFAFAFIIFVTLEMPRLLHEYEMSVDSSNLVYIGESLKMNIHNTKNSKSKEMTNYIEPINQYLFYTLDKKLTGSNTSTTLVPISEGIGGVEVFSAYANSKSIKNKIILSKHINIAVCPSFNTDLLISPTISVVKGDTYQLTKDFGLGDCSKDIIYKSNNNKIMTVDDNGLIKGINPGKTELVISKFDKTFTVSVTVTNKRIDIKSLSVDHDKVQLMPGGKFRLNINQLPSNSTSINTKCISSNANVATVTNEGLIEAVSPGIATITTSYGDIKKNVSVIVDDIGLKQKKASDITIDKETLNLKKGTSHKVYTLVAPDEAINSLSIWNSSNEDVAIVDHNGVIYAKNVGNANITVKNGDIIKTIKLTITK